MDRSGYECFADVEWRLNHLYHITDKNGHDVVFKMNDAQRDFFNGLHEVNVILKARQLGFSTFILIYALDYCLFNPGGSAGVIAQGLVEAEDLFRNKVKYAYDRLPRWLKRRIGATSDTARKLEFSNGSSIQVGTSLRGGTFQVLHVSEYGKIAARYPDKAREIKTGALNTVHLGQRIFIESTAEGRYGEFYDLVQRAKNLELLGAELTPLDPKFFFYGWNWRSEYRLKGDVSLKESDNDYFADLKKQGVDLDSEQKSWYIKKREQQGDDMTREFPSIDEEAFQQSMEGAYFTKSMSLVRKQKQICSVPWEPARLVDTWWDLGMNDSMTIWFFQNVGGQHLWIDYFEDSNSGLDHYAQVLRQKGYRYGVHYWPHDGNVRDMRDGKKRIDIIREFGVHPVKLVPRTPKKTAEIDKLRIILPKMWFDEDKCEVGIKHLDNYQKEWNDKLGVWKDSPLHNAASHGVDPLLLFAQYYNTMKADEVPSYFIDEYTGYEKITYAEDYDPLDV